MIQVITETKMKTLLIIIAIIYLLKLLTRYLGPLLLLYFSKKIAAKFGAQFEAKFNRQGTENQNNKTNSNAEIPKSKKVVGEYIDFEEID